MEKNNTGRTSRNKGNNAERQYAKVFRDLGFSKCVTSRYGSRQHDDAAIDLINIPINVQIKAGKQKGLKPQEVLKDMSNRIVDKFPSTYPEQHYPKIVIHRAEITKGKRRTDFDDMVHITFNDFVKLIKQIKWE